MKSINVSFSYRGKDYKLSAKFKWEKGKPVLTTHKCNEPISFDNFENEWNVYNWDNGVEVDTDDDMTEILNVILWDAENTDSTALAMLGEFDNYKGEIKGVW